jgi:glycine C-acetyltransferase
VPKDVIMLRIIPTAAHTIADVEETILAFKQIKENLAAGAYAGKLQIAQVEAN